MQGWSLAVLRGLIRVLPAPALRWLNAWALREAQRRAQRRRRSALVRR